jgi:hypothetical protein
MSLDDLLKYRWFRWLLKLQIRWIVHRHKKVFEELAKS